MHQVLPVNRRYLPVAYIRPRSAAALLPPDDDPGLEVVERLLQLARRMLP